MSQEKQEEWSGKTEASETCINMEAALAMLEATDLGAILCSLTFLCMEIDELKAEIHKLKSKKGMKQ